MSLNAPNENPLTAVVEEQLIKIFPKYTPDQIDHLTQKIEEGCEDYKLRDPVITIYKKYMKGNEDINSLWIFSQESHDLVTKWAEPPTMIKGFLYDLKKDVVENN